MNIDAFAPFISLAMFFVSHAKQIKDVYWKIKSARNI